VAGSSVDEDGRELDKLVLVAVPAGCLQVYDHERLVLLLVIAKRSSLAFYFLLLGVNYY
jgi:hypothetical protein